MDLGYTELLIVLLLAFMAYSVWARLNPLYLVGGAILLLLAAFVLQAAGDPTGANDLAIDTFLVLLAGLALVLIDRIRAARSARLPAPSLTRAAEPAADPASPR